MSRKSNEPFLSVIIPVYNAEKYLIKCLDSIICQTFRDFEVIVIDDGSTDSSFAIVNEYKNKDDRISIYREENRGCYVARLYGISKSKGQYVTFCDADDYYCSKYAFEKLHKYIVAYKCDVVQFSYVRIYNHLSRKIRPVNRPVVIESDIFLLQEYPRLIAPSYRSGYLYSAVWTKVYRKECFYNMPLTKEPERIFWWEDTVFNLQALLNIKQILFVPDVFYAYRQFFGGTFRFSKRMMKDLNIVKFYQLHYFYKYYPNEEYLIDSLFSEMASVIYWWVKQAMQQIDEEEVKNLLSEAMSLPTIKSATEYYRSIKTDDQVMSVKLLRNADPEEYLRHMKEKNTITKHMRIGKRELIALIKAVYKRL